MPRSNDARKLKRIARVGKLGVVPVEKQVHVPTIRKVQKHVEVPEMASFVKAEGEATEKALKEHVYRCDYATKNPGFAINTATANKEELEESMKKGASDIEVSAFEIEAEYGVLVEVPKVQMGEVVKQDPVIHKPLGIQAVDPPSINKQMYVQDEKPLSLSTNGQVRKHVEGPHGHVITMPEVVEGVVLCTVTEVFVTEGHSIQANDPLCAVQSGETCEQLLGPYTGKVAEVQAKVANVLLVGSALLVVEVVLAPQACEPVLCPDLYVHGYIAALLDYEVVRRTRAEALIQCLQKELEDSQKWKKQRTWYTWHGSGQWNRKNGCRRFLHFLPNHAGCFSDSY